MCIEENNKLIQTKSIEKCVEREKNIMLLDFIQDIINEVKKKSLYDNLYSNLSNYIKQDIPVKDIDQKWLEGYRQYLLTSKVLSVNSARAYFLKLNTVLNKAVRAGYIESSPGKKVETIKSQKVRKQYLTIDEINSIAALPPGKYETIKRAFLFACFTGLRRVSIFNLKYSDINANRIERVDEKTREYEYFDMSDSAMNIIFKQGIPFNASGKVFEGLKYHSMTNELKEFIKPLNIKKNITFHSARHTYATLLLTQGVDLFVVSKLLGHADIKTTQVYSNIVDKLKQKAVKSLPVIELTG